MSEGFHDQVIEVVEANSDSRTRQQVAQDLARIAVNQGGEQEISRSEVERLMREWGVPEEAVARKTYNQLQEWEQEGLLVFRGSHWDIRDPFAFSDQSPEFLARHPFEQYPEQS